jgi:pSer/pThr/pTyr-binding forkhead associated (FHA) protein
MLAREGGITIGRDPESTDLQLPENGVSRTHACIELGATGLVISDLNSTNGIQVNEQHLNSYNPQAPVYDGTVIHLGDTALRIEIIYST